LSAVRTFSESVARIGAGVFTGAASTSQVVNS